MKAGVRRLVAALGVLSLWLAPALAEAQAQPVRGAALDPSALDPARSTDLRGMTNLIPARRRTPSGLLYPYPPEPWRGTDVGGGWLASGALEGGALFDAGDGGETYFGRFADWDDGLWLRWLDAQVIAPQGGWFARFAAGDVARDDAFYRLDAGRPGVVRLRASWSRLPVAYANDARVLWDGAGSNTLTLPGGLVPGATGTPAVADALARRDTRELSVQHDERHLDLAWRPDARWRLYAGFDEDERRGERPFGGSLGFPSSLATLVETVEPIDQVTRRAQAGLEWSHARVQASARYTLSVFRNREDELTFDVPFAGDPDVARGRFALAPDNLWQEARGEFAIALPWRGRASAAAGWSRARQNDDLLAPTVNGGTVGSAAFGVVDLDRWNQAASRARSHADASIDQLFLNAAAHVSPWRPLRLGLRLRVFDHDDDTDYVAWNPLTGQIGYIAEDGALEAQTPVRRILVSGRRLREDFRFERLPTSYQTRLAQATADWRVAGKTKLGAVAEREEIRREYRERDEVHEEGFRLTATTRDFEPLTLRLSAEVARRGGGPYDADFLRDRLASSLPGAVLAPAGVQPYALADLRMHDLASRLRYRGELRIQWLVRDDMDAALFASLRDDDYDTDWGLTDDRALDVSAEWSWQPSPRASVFAALGFERSERRQASINDSNVRPSLDASAGGAVFPYANAWHLDARDRTHSAQVGFELRPHERVRLSASWMLLDAKTRLSWDFASAGALAPGVGETDAGDELPALRLREHIVTSQLAVEITPHVEVGLLYRLEDARVDDFHQTGLEPLVVPGAIYLGHEDRSFRAHLVGTWLRLGF